MAIQYKPGLDIVAMLKAAGYTTYRLRREHLISESALTKMRGHVLPSWNELNTLCSLLKVQPWELLEYTENETPNAATGAAMREADEITADPDAKGYADVDALFSEMKTRED